MAAGGVFALIGNISIEVLGSPTKLARSTRYRYGKLDTVTTKPLLQWIGEDLEQIQWSGLIHQFWSLSPQNDINTLKSIASNHLVVPITLGYGGFLGNYVIQELEVKDIWMAPNGNQIALEFNMDLMEWSGTIPIGSTQQYSTKPAAILGQANLGISAQIANGIGYALLAKQLVSGGTGTVKALAGTAVRSVKGMIP